MNVKGTRDFLPEEMILRQQVLDNIRNSFEIFGFQPLDTPALETWETLSSKGAGGKEILDETYNFKDKGDRMIGLRYDLTVPLARVVSSNPNLNLPFKRYQIGNVWRYGDVAKARFRQFLQADIDIVGSESMNADAEVIWCAITVLNSLGFKKFLVRINNRKILEAIVKYAGVDKKKTMDVFRAIDKLEKVGVSAVKKEMKEKGLTSESIEKIIELISIKGEPDKVLKKLETNIDNDGIKELKEIIKYLKDAGVDSKFTVDLSLARGLEYYTGPIFEVFAEDGIGSIAGGGRYDKMIGLFGGKDVPATGISFGIERIIEVINDRKMIDSKKSNVNVFVIGVNEKMSKNVLEIVKKLREKTISADYDLRSRSMSKQLNYANSSGIPFVVIIGEKELEKSSVKLKNMSTGKEDIVKISDVAKKLLGSRP